MGARAHTWRHKYLDIRGLCARGRYKCVRGRSLDVDGKVESRQADGQRQEKREYTWGVREGKRVQEERHRVRVESSSMEKVVERERQRVRAVVWKDSREHKWKHRVRWKG